MHRLVSPFLTVILMAFLFSPAQAAPAAQGCGVPVSVDGATVLTGDGKQNTRPFDLAAGAHTIRWSGSPKGQFPGNLIMMLKRTDGPLGTELLVNTLVGGDKPAAAGETQVYNVKAGPYYLEVMAPGEWSVTIAPQ